MTWRPQPSVPRELLCRHSAKKPYCHAGQEFKDLRCTIICSFLSKLYIVLTEVYQNSFFIGSKIWSPPTSLCELNLLGVQGGSPPHSQVQLGMHHQSLLVLPGTTACWKKRAPNHYVRSCMFHQEMPLHYVRIELLNIQYLFFNKYSM